MNRNQVSALLVHVLFSFALAYPSLLTGQEVQATTNTIVQLTFLSRCLYQNPHTDVAIECQLTGPGGVTKRVSGFWDGDSTYRVRFLLPIEGIWNYLIICSDTTNAGLHGIRGIVRAAKYRGRNIFSSKGNLRVSSNGRFLTYADGDPFFYLGDTAWEITWKSRPSEVVAYLADRKKKGFNIIHVVGMSHQFFFDWGILNRDGQQYFLNHDYSQLNPRYFDYLDWLIATANETGVAVALVPLWATMTEYHANPSEHHKLSGDQALLVARYYAARYGASNVVWIAGGDCAYTTQEEKQFWVLFAQTLKFSSGGGQLISIHPKGWSASFEYFPNETHCFAFNMYQSSHVAGGDFTWKAGLKGWSLTPPKPLLNAEPCFEDIPTQFWNEEDSAAATKSRITTYDVRRAAYGSVLSGSQVGIAYGANGVWQWNVEGLPVSSFPRDTVAEALKYAGSTQMTHLKNLMVQNRWFELQPSPDIIEQQAYNERFVPVASNAENIVVYLPKHTDSVSFRQTALTNITHYQWFNPRTGDSLGLKARQATQLFSPPDTNDWVLVLNRQPEQPVKPVAASQYMLDQNYPNPFNLRTLIRYQVLHDGRISMKLFNILGSEIMTLVNDDLAAGIYSVSFDGSSLPSGVYFYRLQTREFVEAKKMIMAK